MRKRDELLDGICGEKATTEITKARDSRGTPELKEDAKDGGDIAGQARRNLELKTGRPVVSIKGPLQLEEERRKALN